MNLLDCQDYLTTLNVGITAEDISEYNNQFSMTCQMYREIGDIEVKDYYTDEELYYYSVKVMDDLVQIKNSLALKLKYLLDEGFIIIKNDGTVGKFPIYFKPLTENDFSDVEGEK